MMYYNRCALNSKQLGADSDSNRFHRTAISMIALCEPFHIDSFIKVLNSIVHNDPVRMERRRRIKLKNHRSPCMIKSRPMSDHVRWKTPIMYDMLQQIHTGKMTIIHAQRHNARRAAKCAGSAYFKRHPHLHLPPPESQTSTMIKAM